MHSRNDSQWNGIENVVVALARAAALPLGRSHHRRKAIGEGLWRGCVLVGSRTVLGIGRGLWAVASGGASDLLKPGHTTSKMFHLV